MSRVRLSIGPKTLFPTDKLLNAVKLVDMLEPVPSTEIRIIDCIFEAHNYGVHYLGHLKSALAGDTNNIPPFRHTNIGFRAENQIEIGQPAAGTGRKRKKGINR